MDRNDYETKWIRLVKEYDPGPGYACDIDLPVDPLSNDEITAELRGGWRIVAAIVLEGEPHALAERLAERLAL